MKKKMHLGAKVGVDDKDDNAVSVMEKIMPGTTRKILKGRQLCSLTENLVAPLGRYVQTVKTTGRR